MRTSRPFGKLAPKAYAALLALQETVDSSGLDATIVQLVGLRASQINGCAFCLAMHAHDARRLGMDPVKVDTVAGWRDDPAFTEPERAALEWTEVLTRVAGGAAPDEPYQTLRAHFDEPQIAALTMAVAVINVWNRLNVGLGVPPRRSA